MAITATPVSTADLRKGLKDVLDDARLRGRCFEVRNHDRVAAYIISPEDMALLERLKQTTDAASSPAPTLGLVRSHAAELRAALEPLGASRFAVFGSVARGDATSASDVDLLVDLADGTGLFELLKMERLAGDILGYSVDVVPRNSLKPDIAVSVVRDEVAL